MKSLIAGALLILVAGPAFAQAGYQAVLSQPQTTKAVVKDVMWTCSGVECRAARTGASPDVSVCTAVARKLGSLASFTAAGTTFDANRLAKCNAAAD